MNLEELARETAEKIRTDNTEYWQKGSSKDEWTIETVLAALRQAIESYELAERNKELEHEIQIRENRIIELLAAIEQERVNKRDEELKQFAARDELLRKTKEMSIYYAYVVDQVVWGYEHKKGTKTRITVIAKTMREAIAIAGEDEQHEIEFCQNVGAVARGIPELIKSVEKAKVEMIEEKLKQTLEEAGKENK